MVQTPIHIMLEAGKMAFVSIAASMAIGRNDPAICENQNQPDAFPFNRQLIDALIHGFCTLLRSNKYTNTDTSVMTSVTINAM